MYVYIIYNYIYVIQSKHCKKIPCIRKWGAGFFCRIYGLWNIYANGSWEIEGPWNFKGYIRNLDVCEGAPLRPCSIFLTMKWFIKIGAGNGASLPCNQTPAKMKFAQPWHGWEWQARRQGRPTVEPLHGCQACWQQFSQTPARLTVRHLSPWLVLPSLALLCLALPCLCCLVATG